MFFVLNKRQIFTYIFILLGFSFLFIIAVQPTSHVPVFSMEGEDSRTVVVIDAGHGGFDGGAVADDGTTEAEINLSVALKLEEIFSLLGHRTVMVRREDVSIDSPGKTTIREKKVSDIHNRVDQVNQIENALLISIHQNSLPQVKSVHGAQVFYNSKTPAAELAHEMQKAFNITINSGNEKEEKQVTSGIYMMEHITAPGVLVECGFVSNPQETQQLKDDKYQTRLALTIAAGYLCYETTKDEVAVYEEQNSVLLHGVRK